MRRMLSIVSTVAVLLIVIAMPAQAQVNPSPVNNTIAINFGGSELDAMAASVAYSRRMITAENGVALWGGVNHPVGSLTGAALDGDLNLGGLDWSFSDVSRGFLAPRLRLQMNRLLSFSATFGEVCIVHAEACDGYLYARLTVDVTLPTAWVPVTIRFGREGLIGDGELDGEWLRSIKIGTRVGF